MKYTTAIDIRQAIEEGKITAVEVTQHYLNKIHTQDGEVGAFLETFDEDALASAKEIDNMKERGEALPRLAGVPVAIKDVILVKGQTASAGSKILEGYKASYDATAVKKLKEAGAVIIGRTNCDEFAMGSSTQTSFYQKTKNPWDLTRVPGGSSGGSAVAVAAGFVPIALGSDTGGSVRQPAGFCNIVGLKPTYGKVSRYGLMALCSSFDQISPFATTVKDAALVLEVIAGQDEHDATSRVSEEVVSAELLVDSIGGMTFGVPKEYFVDGMDPGVKKCVQEAIEKIKQLGGKIKEISLPLTEYALSTYYILLPAEASSNLAKYDGIRYGNRPEADTLKDIYLRARGEGFGEEVKRRIMIGTYVLSAGYYDAFYKKSLAVRTAIFDEFMKAFNEVDVIISPTSPGLPWKLEEKLNDPIALYLADIFTLPANIAGICAISVPCGFLQGLPVGIQFMAAPMKEGNVLRAANAYESASDWHAKRPPGF